MQKQNQPVFQQQVLSKPPNFLIQQTSQNDFCPSTMGGSHQYENGICKMCNQPDPKTLPKEIKQVPITGWKQDFCPSTKGGSHQYDSGICKMCKQPDPKMQVPKTGIENEMCPSTMGGKHRFVQGVCKDCGCKK